MSITEDIKNFYIELERYDRQRIRITTSIITFLIIFLAWVIPTEEFALAVIGFTENDLQFIILSLWTLLFSLFFVGMKMIYPKHVLCKIFGLISWIFFVFGVVYFGIVVYVFMIIYEVYPEIIAN